MGKKIRAHCQTKNYGLCHTQNFQLKKWMLHVEAPFIFKKMEDG
jgi:hypothetical protein